MFGVYVALAALIFSILCAFTAGVWRVSGQSTRLEMKVDANTEITKATAAELHGMRAVERRVDRLEGANEVLARALGVRVQRHPSRPDIES